MTGESSLLLLVAYLLIRVRRRSVCQTQYYTPIPAERLPKSSTGAAAVPAILLISYLIGKLISLKVVSAEIDLFAILKRSSSPLCSVADCLDMLADRRDRNPSDTTSFDPS